MLINLGFIRAYEDCEKSWGGAMGITALDHWVLTVSDIEMMTAFYGDTLGMAPLQSITIRNPDGNPIEPAVSLGDYLSL